MSLISRAASAANVLGLEALADAAARVDPIAFAEMTARDEVSGRLIVLETYHRSIVDVLVTEKRAAIEAYAGAGKSTLVPPAVGWLIAHNPSLRVALVSGTMAQSSKQVASVARLIESPEAQRIFPALRPGDQWNQSALSIAAKPAHVRDPNVQPVSLDAGAVLGSRIDLVICDDVDSLATISTPAARDATWRWFTSTILSRLTPGGRIIVLSTTWHRDDLLHRFARLGEAA